MHSSYCKAWEANKRHLDAMSGPKALANYGVRKEVTLLLDGQECRTTFQIQRGPSPAGPARMLGTRCYISVCY